MKRCPSHRFCRPHQRGPIIQAFLGSYQQPITRLKYLSRQLRNKAGQQPIRMTRRGGPNNTTHNFLDMACSGFTEKAQKRFKRNQEHEKRTREENRLRRQRSRDGMSTYISSSSSKSVPGFVPGKQLIPGLIPRRPKSVTGNRVDVACPPASARPSLSKMENEVALPLRLSGTSHHTRPRQPRSQSEPQGSSHQSNVPSAFPATVHDDTTVRAPTAEAPLMDAERTHMEGLRVPTGLHSTFSRRPRYFQR